MTRLIRYSIYLCILLISTACTQNNGNIGNLFGAWSLEAMTVGSDDKEFPDNEYTTLRFQNEIACFSRILNDQIETNRYCTWTRSDNSITFDFKHHDNTTEQGQNYYAAPEWLDMPLNSTFTMTIRQLDSKHLVLTWQRVGLAEITYKFDRTW